MESMDYVQVQVQVRLWINPISPTNFFYHFYISTSTFFSPKKKHFHLFFLFFFYFNGWNNFKFQSIIIASIVISFLKYGLWSRDMKKIYNHPCSVPTILQMQLFLH